MRINPKLYKVADSVEPFEVQNFETRKVELFFMDSFNGIEEEFVRNKGQFATWSSENGNDYRLFLERGYYEACKELYSNDVNKIWTEFWDATDKIYKKFSRCFLIPVIIVLLILSGVSFALGDIGSYIMLGALLVMMVVYFIGSRYMKKKTLEENTKSRDLIIQKLGEKHFDSLIETQKEYMDTYFDKFNEDVDDEDSEDSTSDENKEDKTEEVEVKEENEVVSDETNTEVKEKNE